MVEHGGAHREHRVIQHDIASQYGAVLARPPERLFQTKCRALRFAAFAEFGHMEDEIGRKAVDQVPGIAAELVFDTLDDPRRADDPHRPVAPEQHPQHLIEADEMVDMGMRHENVRDAQDFARGHPMQITKIEQKRPFLELDVDIERRIAETIVYEFGIEAGRHQDLVAFHPDRAIVLAQSPASYPLKCSNNVPIWLVIKKKRIFSTADKVSPGKRNI